MGKAMGNSFPALANEIQRAEQNAERWNSRTLPWYDSNSFLSYDVRTLVRTHGGGEPRSPPGGDGGSIGRSGEPPPDMSHLQPGGGGPAQRKATVVWRRGVWDSRLPLWLGNTQYVSIVRQPRLSHGAARSGWVAPTEGP